MSARLLQISGAVVDLLYEVEAVPRPGEEAIVTGFSIAPGGGFNAMAAAKRSGMDVAYGGGLGTGPFASILRDGLTREGIPSLRRQDQERDQGCCTVMIDQTGERTFVAREGADGHVTAGAIAELAAHQFDWTILSGYMLHYAGARPAIQSWLQSAAEIKNLVFDPTPIVAALPQEALQAACDRATWISANRSEATVLTGLSDPHAAARALASRMPDDGGVVLRLGQDGCLVATSEICETLPPFEVASIDTTGAGDTHLGSFIARLARGDDPIEAARYANVAAALSTTKPGPATAPDESQVTAARTQKEAV